ncbi:MAG TPA: hypothetical protein VHE34_08640 [Puia sp.]|uniref:hypothetical protein n=1 Tax=Puia sp. TaxID=2045100 RepID=UPI002CB4B49D|nr:hypothetical protein [Puia sp.]HVU95277.1 hypothetical protein [Puia sp.]
MKLVPIFAPCTDEGLWSIWLDGRTQSEFERFFSCVSRMQWLYEFFEQNEADLASGFFGEISIDTAILWTLAEAKDFENAIFTHAQRGSAGNPINLQHLFKPLNNFEYTIAAHQKSKARIDKGWLRLYAIRLAENCYLVTGGAIKLTRDMKRAHLQNELKKLELAKRYLHDNLILFPEDLNTYNNE